MTLEERLANLPFILTRKSEVGNLLTAFEDLRTWPLVSEQLRAELRLHNRKENWREEKIIRQFMVDAGL